MSHFIRHVRLGTAAPERRSRSAGLWPASSAAGGRHSRRQSALTAPPAGNDGQLSRWGPPDRHALGGAQGDGVPLLRQGGVSGCSLSPWRVLRDAPVAVAGSGYRLHVAVTGPARGTCRCGGVGWVVTCRSSRFSETDLSPSRDPLGSVASVAGVDLDASRGAAGLFQSFRTPLCRPAGPQSHR